MDDRTDFCTVLDLRTDLAYTDHVVGRDPDSFYRRDSDTAQLVACPHTDYADAHHDLHCKHHDVADCRDAWSQSQSGAASTPCALRLVGHIPLIFLFTGFLSL